MIKYCFAKFNDWEEIREQVDEDLENSNLSVIPITNKKVFKEHINKKQIIIAKNNKEIIGLIQFNKRKDGVTHITNLWVKPENRKKRIGSKLLSIIHKPIQLNCIADNPALIFYLKNSFKIKGYHYNKNNKKIIELIKKG